LPANSSWTDKLACLRQTESSCDQSVLRMHTPLRGTYGRHSEKHDYKLFLIEYGVPDKCICESCQSFPSFLQEASICSYRIAVD